jgi:hypothetical protein
MFTKKPDGSGLTNEARSVPLGPSSVPQTPGSFQPPRASANVADGAPFVTSGRVLANGAAKTSVIAADLTVTGKLVAQGEVVVEGIVQGDVDALYSVRYAAAMWCCVRPAALRETFSTNRSRSSRARTSKAARRDRKLPRVRADVSLEVDDVNPTLSTPRSVPQDAHSNTQTDEARDADQSARNGVGGAAG